MAEAGQWESCDKIIPNDIIFCGACKGGHRDIVELMIAEGRTCWNLGMGHACRGGHIGIIDFMIANGATNWDLGLRNALVGNHFDVAEVMIARGAVCGFDFIRAACIAGNLNSVKFIIRKCDDRDRLSSIYYACRGGHREIIDFIIATIGRGQGHIACTYCGGFH